MAAKVQNQGYTVEALRCAICKAVVTEMEIMVSKVKSTVLVDVGSYRIDEKGNKKSKTIPLVQSESFLMEAMESACGRMEKYARGYDKATGQLRIVKMKLGKSLNPEMSEIIPISDADLNESLKFHCEDIMDEYEDTFLKVFKARRSDSANLLCMNETELCHEEKVPKLEL